MYCGRTLLTRTHANDRDNLRNLDNTADRRYRVAAATFVLGRMLRPGGEYFGELPGTVSRCANA